MGRERTGSGTRETELGGGGGTQREDSGERELAGLERQMWKEKELAVGLDRWNKVWGGTERERTLERERTASRTRDGVGGGGGEGGQQHRERTLERVGSKTWRGGALERKNWQ